MDEQSNGHAERVIKQGRALGEDVRNLASELSQAAGEVKGRFDFSQAVQEHPFRSLAIAAGVGYVLGGGLFSPLTGRLVGIGTRAMLLPFLKNQFVGMVAGATGEQT